MQDQRRGMKARPQPRDQEKTRLGPLATLEAKVASPAGRLSGRLIVPAAPT